MGEGNVFSLFTPVGGCTPFPFHITFTGPMSFLGVPNLHSIILQLVPGPFKWYPSPRWGLPESMVREYPSHDRVGYPPSRTGWCTLPHPGQDRMGHPPARSGWGTPSPPPGQVVLRHVTAQVVHVLRFAAGGLSCYYNELHLKILVDLFENYFLTRG